MNIKHFQTFRNNRNKTDSAFTEKYDKNHKRLFFSNIDLILQLFLL